MVVLHLVLRILVAAALNLHKYLMHSRKYSTRCLWYRLLRSLDSCSAYALLLFSGAILGTALLIRSQ
ncbi:unnamed protein product, partial [Callosobruchus maculatus]